MHTLYKLCEGIQPILIIRSLSVNPMVYVDVISEQNCQLLQAVQNKCMYDEHIGIKHVKSADESHL